MNQIISQLFFEKKVFFVLYFNPNCCLAGIKEMRLLRTPILIRVCLHFQTHRSGRGENQNTAANLVQIRTMESRERLILTD
jgi:hypothetical protein